MTDESRLHWLEYLRRSGAQNATFESYLGVYSLALPADVRETVREFLKVAYERERDAAGNALALFMAASK